MKFEADWLRKWARYAPASIALKDAETDREWSYGLLYKMSSLLAHELRERFEIQPGARVAVLATNEIEFIPLFFAIQRAGAIMVPINFRLAPPEIAHILKDSAPDLLIYQETFTPALEKIEPQLVPEKRWRWDATDGLSSLVNRISAEFSLPQEISSLHADLPTWLFPFPLSTCDETACKILYTSGTTGFPKGAIITHGMLFWNAVNTSLRLNIDQSDVTLSFLPFFHTGGWNVLLTPFLHRGACTVFLKKFEPARVLQLCAQEKVSILFGVPTTMDMMAQTSLFHQLDLSHLRYAIVGGEPMPVELIKTWQNKGVPIRQGFGLTEFGPNVFSLNEEDSLRKIGSIGFPNFYIDVRVVDQDGKDVNDGEIGELILHGPVCTPGYWGNRAATADAIREGWFYTGDLVRRDSEGYYYVAGRKKDMFISGGENVYPVEIERHLSAHPAVREVAVIGVQDEKWGEVGKAFIALNPGHTVEAQDLIRYCEGHLAKFKIPKHVQFLNDLPKGDSGKLLKRKLRDLTSTL